MRKNLEDFNNLRRIILREKKMLDELTSLTNYLQKAEVEERKMIYSQITLLKKAFKKTNSGIPAHLQRINLMQPLNPKPSETKIDTKSVAPKKKEVLKKRLFGLKMKSSTGSKKYTLKDLKPTHLEKKTLKRMKKKREKVEVEKEKKPSKYVALANRWFSEISEKIVDKRTFQDLERDLIKANLQFTPRSYISVIILTTCFAFCIGIIIGLFFLFFNIGAALPIITRATEGLASRWWKPLIVVVLAPALTFIMMYIYPNLEKSSASIKIEEELPFATIHMSAISGSMIDPSKIFDIIISTKEYPALEKEFKKLINEINLFGYDLVSALRNSAYNSPSKKLSELLNGLATTINSGGFLPEFFEKRSQTLLFENSLNQEKKTKAAETFMDIYISMVIAAPMILMILLVMMKISGLGISMSTSTITIIMVLVVTTINIVFLTFLQLKR